MTCEQQTASTSICSFSEDLAVSGIFTAGDLLIGFFTFCVFIVLFTDLLFKLIGVYDY